MKHLILLVAVTLLPLTAAAGQKGTTLSKYTGNVGKLPAKFELSWDAGGKVRGSYYYPTRDKKITYILIGNNSTQGKLYLEEFERIDDALHLTARCYLSKTIEKGVVIWRGTMKNTDGRSFQMEMRKTN